MKNLLLLALLTLGVWITPSNASLVNGDFENGNLSGWTTHSCIGNCSSVSWSVGSSHPAAGTYAARTACVGSACLDPVTGDWIGQTPGGVISGTAYLFSILIDPIQASCSSCEIDIYWGGTLQAAYSSLASGYMAFPLTLIGGAGDGLNFLEITGRHDPATVYIDNVSFESAVPEPISIGLVGCGITAGALLRRKRRA